MANDQAALFNFYKRYRWRAQDFTDFQTGMIDHTRGVAEGLVSAAVLEGYDISLNGDMTMNVNAGIAVGPTGYLNVINDDTLVTFTAPSANFERALIVVRPAPEDSDFITRPLSPFDSVPLKSLEKSSIEIIRGAVAASPVYPSVLDNDVVICGVRLAAGQSVIAENDLDFEVRDIPGKNTNFQENQGKYDDRLRPYRSTNKVVGLKPSQLLLDNPRGFVYVSGLSPSIYPTDGSGNYVHADTFLDLESGAITGGDGLSSDITPSIPTSGNAIVAAIGVKSDNTLVVGYGTVGTRAQCYAGIKNQKSAGAGSVSIPAFSKPIAFVIVFSGNGTNVTEIDVVDIRGNAFVATVDTSANIRPSEGSGTTTLLSTDSREQVFNLTASHTVVLPSAGISKGDKIVLENRGAFDLLPESSDTTPLTLTNVGSGSKGDPRIRVGRVEFKALVANPSTPSDWLVTDVYETGTFTVLTTTGLTVNQTVTIIFERHNLEVTMFAKSPASSGSGSGNLATASHGVDRLYPSAGNNPRGPTTVHSNRFGANNYVSAVFELDSTGTITVNYYDQAAFNESSVGFEGYLTYILL